MELGGTSPHEGITHSPSSQGPRAGASRQDRLAQAVAEFASAGDADGSEGTCDEPEPLDACETAVTASPSTHEDGQGALGTFVSSANRENPIVYISESRVCI